MNSMSKQGISEQYLLQKLYYYKILQISIIYQRRVLEYPRWAPRPLLGVCNVCRKRVLLNLKSEGWALWRFGKAQVRQALRVREDQEMRHTQRTGNIDKVLEVIPLLLLPIVSTFKCKTPMFQVGS